MDTEKLFKNNAILYLLNEFKLTFRRTNLQSNTMKQKYDFSKMKARKNPYASKLKRQVANCMRDDVISPFDVPSVDTAITTSDILEVIRDSRKR